ncbi:MAG: hypothetical protein HRU09_13895 [Oligoflexales bacterium]|nr:hypothetical protein [Oligoflexales bacterium]
MDNVGAGAIKKVLEAGNGLLSQLSIPLALKRKMEFQFAHTYVMHHSQAFTLVSNDYKLYVKHELEVLDLPTAHELYNFILAKEEGGEDESDEDDVELF